MIIDIAGHTASGKTTSIVNLLDKDKDTLVISGDGDFDKVYEHVTGNDIFVDFGTKIHFAIAVGEYSIVSENIKSIIDDFLSKDESSVLVIDSSYVHSDTVRVLKERFAKTKNRDKTLIVSRTLALRYE